MKLRKNLGHRHLELKLRVGNAQLSSEHSSHRNAGDKWTPTQNWEKIRCRVTSTDMGSNPGLPLPSCVILVKLTLISVSLLN